MKYKLCDPEKTYAHSYGAVLYYETGSVDFSLPHDTDNLKQFMALNKAPKADILC